MITGPSGIYGTGVSMTNGYNDALSDKELIEKFLEHTVDDYLIGDLRTIFEPEKLAPNELGYPSVLLIMIGAELLGHLLDESCETQDAAENFWNYMVKVNSSTYKSTIVGRQLYSLARNGIAHFYSPNPCILVHRNFGENFSIKMYDGKLRFFINCHSLFEDFIKAYSLVKEFVLNDTANLPRRANTIRETLRKGRTIAEALCTTTETGIEDYSQYRGMSV